MKVLIVFNHPAPYKVRMFNALSKSVDLTVIFERNKAKDRNESFYSFNTYDFNCITLKDGYVSNEGSLSSGVRDYIKKNHKKYDFIIMNGYSHLAEIKAIIYMQRNNINYGLMVNGGFIKKNELQIKKQLKTRLISGASFYFSPTQDSDKYLTYYGANPSSIHRYVYSNISEKDFDLPCEDTLKVKTKYGLPTNQRIFLNCSQFIDRKNNFQLIKIFENLPHFLVLAGEGKEQTMYEKYIKEKNIKNILIIPFLTRNDLTNLMRSCDTFISLAKEDIFGHTIIEALANGLPVIASNKINSAVEYINDGINGYVVNIENNEEILNSIKNTADLSKKNAINSVKELTVEHSAADILMHLNEENING